jgi:hypothetical protein
LDEYNKEGKMQLNIAAFEGHKNYCSFDLWYLWLSCFHQYTLRIVDADRNGLMQHLLDKGIPCAIYYLFLCMHKKRIRFEI